MSYKIAPVFVYALEKNDSMDQKLHVIQNIRSHDKIKKAFTYRDHGTDWYVLVTSDDDDALYSIAELYWTLFDEYPGYRFQFRTVTENHFHEVDLPESALDMKVRDA